MDTNPTAPDAAPKSERGSRIKKADKDQIMRNVFKSFQHSFPQLDLDSIQGLTKYFGELMCRKIAKTPLYITSGTVTVQTLRDAFAAVLADRILHKNTVLADSVPVNPTAAAIVCGMSSPFDGPAEAMTDGDTPPMTEINPQPTENPNQQKFDFYDKVATDGNETQATNQ